jgi:ATP-binding cassette subfamily B multidrug efflux pump
MMKFLQKIKDKFYKHFHIEISHLPDDGRFILPQKFWPFVWFFLKQVKGLLLLISALAALEALSISYTYWYIGQVVGRQTFDFDFLILGLLILAVRPIAANALRFCENALYIPYFGNMIRRQCFYYTSRQSLAFFQNDFSGRIANKILQCSSAIRDATLSIVLALVFVCTLLITNVALIVRVDVFLAIPLIVWAITYICVLCYFLPKIKERTTTAAESMSTLTGQIVDSFTNILAAKYFSRMKQEDDRATHFLKDYGQKMSHALTKSTQQNIVLGVINFLLVGATISVGYWMITNQNNVGISALSMALPMVVQTTFWSGWIMGEMSKIFENLGTVKEGIPILSRPHDVTDQPNAKNMVILDGKADVIFKDVSFNYGQDGPSVLKEFNLSIRPGEKVGLVGQSGAGKSTITSLVLRAYDLRKGNIFIAGQNIAHVTQDSLRENIAIVTQDSYLFHRSVLDNIRYGNPEATLEEVVDAAIQANAHNFILDLVDSSGRKAYEAHVGERGVKLSGGQKQRIDIARAILKNAPILVLDEATSALDSESESAIQSGLASAMEGKTVIAIAHRFSTLRQMDRIIVLDKGMIVEDGTHNQLIQMQGSYYNKLWKLQSEFH